MKSNREEASRSFEISRRRCHLFLAPVAILLILCATLRAAKSPYDWALIRLDHARRDKVMQLRDFCDRMHTLARQAAHDEFVLACFDINLQYADAVKRGPVPETLANRVSDLCDGFNAYYIQKYFSFYDILFVDVQGEVFYTIRKEADLNSNLLQKGGNSCALTEFLKRIPKNEVFVDFHDYGPSSKPAAFFVEPVQRDGALLGWTVLQCGINKVNALLAWTDDLGQTGETFLVNREGYMLTESNFEGASTILKKRLDDRNVQAKFTDRQGHRTVTDYRGYRALTSFEVVEFLGTQWLVVAKMDVDEVVTEHYLQHRKYYADKLLTGLREGPVMSPRELPPLVVRETLRVDMDEFLRADNRERLHTFGISTCTGLLISYPGKLAYLAHISPKDKVYGSNDTNLLGPMIKRIKAFDIYRYERHRVIFVVVAPHLNTVREIVDRLVDEGFFLSQIKVMYHPEAESAALSYDYPEDNLRVIWRLPSGIHTGKAHVMEDVANLGEIVQHVMRAEEEAVQPISEGSLIGAGKATDTSCRAARREEGGPDMCLTGGNTL